MLQCKSSSHYIRICKYENMRHYSLEAIYESILNVVFFISLGRKIILVLLLNHECFIIFFKCVLGEILANNLFFNITKTKSNANFFTYYANFLFLAIDCLQLDKWWHRSCRK